MSELIRRAYRRLGLQRKKTFCWFEHLGGVDTADLFVYLYINRYTFRLNRRKFRYPSCLSFLPILLIWFCTCPHDYIRGLEYAWDLHSVAATVERGRPLLCGVAAVGMSSYSSSPWPRVRRRIPSLCEESPLENAVNVADGAGRQRCRRSEDKSRSVAAAEECFQKKFLCIKCAQAIDRFSRTFTLF